MLGLLIVRVERCESIRMRGCGLSEKLDFPTALLVGTLNLLQDLSVTRIRLEADGTNSLALFRIFSKILIENGQNRGVYE